MTTLGDAGCPKFKEKKNYFCLDGMLMTISNCDIMTVLFGKSTHIIVILPNSRILDIGIVKVLSFRLFHGVMETCDLFKMGFDIPEAACAGDGEEHHHVLSSFAIAITLMGLCIVSLLAVIIGGDVMSDMFPTKDRNGLCIATTFQNGMFFFQIHIMHMTAHFVTTALQGKIIGLIMKYIFLYKLLGSFLKSAINAVHFYAVHINYIVAFHIITSIIASIDIFIANFLVVNSRFGKKKMIGFSEFILPIISKRSAYIGMFDYLIQQVNIIVEDTVSLGRNKEITTTKYSAILLDVKKESIKPFGVCEDYKRETMFRKKNKTIYFITSGSSMNDAPTVLI
ncbi:hypothetical protein ACJX0J_029041 [Zea mays]